MPWYRDLYMLMLDKATGEPVGLTRFTEAESDIYMRAPLNQKYDTRNISQIEFETLREFEALEEHHPSYYSVLPEEEKIKYR